jgi:hypothetical protein
MTMNSNSLEDAAVIDDRADAISGSLNSATRQCPRPLYRPIPEPEPFPIDELGSIAARAIISEV